MADDADGDDWRFSVEEVGPEESDPNVEENGHADGQVELSAGDIPDELVEDDDGDGNVAGSLTSVGPIEPGTASLENAAFVVLGVYAGILALSTLVAPSVFGSIENFLVVTVGVLALALLTFRVFGLLTTET